MSTLRASRSAAVLLLVTLWPTVGFAQSPTPTGVVTGLQGRASVARPVVPQPIPLKFRDDLFLRDQVDTEENSLVRVLLGGKALVTIRELSTFTITEEPGRSAVELKNGKLAVGVAKSLLKPGEVIEIRTPNAISSIRGSLLIVSVKTVGGVLESTFTALDVHTSTPITVTPRVGGPGVVLGVNQALGVSGTGASTVLGPVQNISPETAQREAETAEAPRGGGQDVISPMAADISQAKFQEATALATLLAGSGAPQLLQQPGSPLTAGSQTAVSFFPPPPSTGSLGVNATANDQAISSSRASSPSGSTLGSRGGGTSGGGSNTRGDGGSTSGGGGGTSGGGGTPGRELIVNGGFETGDFSGWMRSGALDHTNVVGRNISFTSPDGRVFEGFFVHSGNFGAHLGPIESDGFLSQTLATVAGRAYVIRWFLRSDGGTPNDFSASWAGQRIFSRENIPFDTSWVPSSFTRVATDASTILQFAFRNVPGFFGLDDVSVIQDPPLYSLGPGGTLTRTGTDPLLRLSGTPQTFDSLMVVCCRERASLAGPLLQATNSDLTVPFSLVSLIQGGSLVSTSTDPLVLLQGGTHSFGSIGLPMIDLAGTNTATDPQTGLTLGTDQPLQIAGPLLATSGATVTAHRAVRIDTALLEATVPLMTLAGRTNFTTATDALALSYQAKVTSLGSLIRLDGSTLTVNSGSLVNVNASKLTVGGDLVKLLNGATLTVSNGPLITVSANGLVNISGSLINFSGTGNKVNITNSLCPCSLFGGVPVALQNGAQATNVQITNPIKNAGDGGQVNLARNAALAVVSGAGSRLTVGGPPGSAVPVR